MRRQLFLIAAACSLFCALVSHEFGSRHRALLQDSAGKDVDRIRTSKSREGITRAAHEAHQTLKRIANVLESSDSSLEKTELKDQVQKALSAVEDLENSGSTDSEDADPLENSGNEDSTTGELSESKAESLVAADAKSIEDSAKGLVTIKAGDNSAIRAELQKLVATARRLQSEMSTFSDKTGAAWSDAESVERAARQVEEEGQHALLQRSRARQQRAEVSTSALYAALRPACARLHVAPPRRATSPLPSEHGPPEPCRTAAAAAAGGAPRAPGRQGQARRGGGVGGRRRQGHRGGARRGAPSAGGRREKKRERAGWEGGGGGGAWSLCQRPTSASGTAASTQGPNCTIILYNYNNRVIA